VTWIQTNWSPTCLICCAARKWVASQTCIPAPNAFPAVSFTPELLHDPHSCCTACGKLDLLAALQMADMAQQHIKQVQAMAEEHRLSAVREAEATHNHATALASAAADAAWQSVVAAERCGGNLRLCTVVQQCVLVVARVGPALG
jgi:hypothetical protein